MTGPAYLGINANLANDPSVVGCKITAVVEGSSASVAGLQIGDSIVGINDQPVTDFLTLTLAVANKSIGEMVEIEYQRADQTFVRQVKLGDRATLGR